MLVYRICKSKRAKDLTGEGARRAGGRWNSKGVPMLYTSEHISLALLEVSVHGSSVTLQLPHSCITIEIPDDPSLYIKIKAKNLESGWGNYPAPETLKNIGDEFIQDNKYLALVVPSAVSEQEWNYLLNPHHPRFNEVKIIDSNVYKIDRRIKE